MTADSDVDRYVVWQGAEADAHELLAAAAADILVQVLETAPGDWTVSPPGPAAPAAGSGNPRRICLRGSVAFGIVTAV